MTFTLTVGVSWRLLSSVVPRVKGPDSTFFRLPFTSIRRSSTSTLRRSASRHASSLCFRLASSEACRLGSEDGGRPSVGQAAPHLLPLSLQTVALIDVAPHVRLRAVLAQFHLHGAGAPWELIRVLLLFYWGMARRFFGFAPPGRMEEGAYGDEVQVDPGVGVLLRPRRVLRVLWARFRTFLRIVVLAVWQAALFSILHRGKEPGEERRGQGPCPDETEIENG
ncbi:hypothetical protein EYF80_044542 [Liparis tanakae]|uniref:Uncharacterized protein n=1 Tax=Liparis tanakae TaxID=230148 RepID=A0A4Z2FWI6_9TELE|nr:hypothetical protein EYF80_044542 [Liparis tanakae]